MCKRLILSHQCQTSLILTQQQICQSCFLLIGEKTSQSYINFCLSGAKIAITKLRNFPYRGIFTDFKGAIRRKKVLRCDYTPNSNNE